MAQIFLCHASEDKTQVREVYQRLREIEGFKPWLDEEDLVGGQLWEQEIPQALQASDFIVIFFSQNSIRKIGYVQNEFKLALDAWRQTPEGVIRTIPVRLETCDVPAEFRRFHWIDLFDEGGVERLVRSIRVGLAQRQQEPIPQPEAPPPAEPTTSQPDRELAEPVDVAPIAAEPEVATPTETKDRLVEIDTTTTTSVDPGLRQIHNFDTVGATQTTLGPLLQINFSRNLDPRITNTLGMEFVLIPAGEFMMGSYDAGDEERPVHKVHISQPFYLGKYEVTQAQWEVVMGSNPGHFKGGPNRPVEQVSWHDAQRFVEKLNEREGAAGYRLPTEAQWEYTCRAGTEGSHYHTDVGAIAWYRENSARETHAVGQKLPNAWGLYDMLGNVWEWVQDWYGRDDYEQSSTRNLQGSAEGASRVIRGGGWGNVARNCRAALRNRYAPVDRVFILGFRLARSAALGP